MSRVACPFVLNGGSTAQRADNAADDQKNQEDEEQYFGDLSCGTCDAAKAEDAGNDCKNKKSHGPRTQIDLPAA